MVTYKTKEMKKGKKTKTKAKQNNEKQETIFNMIFCHKILMSTVHFVGE